MNDIDNYSNTDPGQSRPSGNLGIADEQGQGIKHKLGQSLESAAGALRDRTHDPRFENSKLGKFGADTANNLDRVASYVRDADSQKVRRDIEQTVRTNPGRSLLVAGVAGLLIGSLLRRR